MSDYKIDTLEVETQIIAPVATTTVAGLQSPTDKTKLDSVESGATVNDTDANLRDRSTHTGTQAVGTITGLGALATKNTVSAIDIDDAAVTSLKIANDSIVTDRILSNSVTNLKLSDMGANTIKGNNTVGVADPQDLTVTQVRTMLSINNLDNTSDLNKPISTATQTALNLKYDASNPSNYQNSTEVQSAVNAHANLTNNPHSVTATQVGAAPLSHVGAGGVSQHPNATQTVSGFMSIGDKTKLDGLPAIVPVSSVFGRTGAILPQAGDYNALEILNSPSGNISATTVQTAINELDTEKAKLAGGNAFTGDQSVNTGSIDVGNTTFTHRLSVTKTDLSLPYAGFATKNTAANAHAAIEYIATGKTFFTGVGGSAETLVGLADKYFIYDSTAGASRMIIDTDGRTIVGGNTPNVSAQFQVDSTTRGLLLPRMTTAQMNAIGTPASGLIIYNTDLAAICRYDSGYWKFDYDISNVSVQSTSSSTYANVTELVTASMPTGLYRVSFIGIGQSTSTLIGMGVRLGTGTAAVSTVTINWKISQAANGTDKNFEYSQLASNTNVTSTGVITANTNFPISGNGIIRVTTAGTLVIQIRNEDNITAVSIRPDCYLCLTRIGN